MTCWPYSTRCTWTVGSWNNLKHGIVLCIPKTDIPTTPADYRPITLLNTDYKILARIIADRQRPTLSDVLHPNQYWSARQHDFRCGGDGTGRCRVGGVDTCPAMHPFLDFRAAFDRIAHTYVFRMLKSYDQVLSSVQINGYVAGHVPTRCSVRKGCPKSMLLFALVLSPLLCLLERNLTGIRIRHRTTKTTVVAYADYVTVPEDIQVIGYLLLAY